MHVDCSGDAAVLKTAAEELFHADSTVLVLVQQVDKSSCIIDFKAKYAKVRRQRRVFQHFRQLLRRDVSRIILVHCPKKVAYLLHELLLPLHLFLNR